MKKIITILLISIGVASVTGGGYYFYHKNQVSTAVRKTEAEIMKTDVSKLKGVDPVFNKSVEKNIDLTTKEGLAKLDRNIELMAAKTAALPE